MKNKRSQNEAILEIIKPSLFEVKYKYECYWSQYDGWHFSFGTKRLWQGEHKFIVADLIEVDNCEQYQNHKYFIDLENALNYMGKS